jgi:hypothetical protein
MMELGQTPTAQLEAKLRPLVTAYAAWIDERQADLAKPDMAQYQAPGRTALERCREAVRRIEAGLALLLENENAAEAFRFANLAMWQQRVHRALTTARSWPPSSNDGTRRPQPSFRRLSPLRCSPHRRPSADSGRLKPLSSYGPARMSVSFP